MAPRRASVDPPISLRKAPLETRPPVSETSSTVVARSLSFSYRGKEVLRNVSFHAAAGETIGILGPNGAGKSTLLDLLIGLRRPATGSCHILGHDVHNETASARSVAAIVLQSLVLPPSLSISELCSIVAASRYTSVPSTLFLELGLAGLMARRPSTLSGGERQLVAIGLALIGGPRVLFLDEATSNLGPEERYRAWRAIRADPGRTIVLTTHRLEEAESSCDSVLVLGNRETIAYGSPESLIQQFGSQHCVRLLAERDQLPGVLALLGPTARLTDKGSITEVTAFFSDYSEALQVASTLRRSGIAQGVSVTRCGLESAYLDLVRRMEIDHDPQ
jgi:ABC-2 type transport system ATP-binding protein